MNASSGISAGRNGSSQKAQRWRWAWQSALLAFGVCLLASPGAGASGAGDTAGKELPGGPRSFPRGLLRHHPIQPTGCPFPFSLPTPANQACFFEGSWNSRCRGKTVSGAFASDGKRIVVVFEHPFAFFFAEVKSERNARLVSSGRQRDFSDRTPTDGVVSVSPVGETLVVVPSPPPFQLDGCDFVLYSGAFSRRATSAGTAAHRALALP
jgi:hypothetical protein